jgi:hypothetical protein
LFQSRNLTSIDFRQGRYAKERWWREICGC